MSIFKIGEEKFKTTAYKKVSVKIGNHQEEIEVGIIEVEIPLAISKRKL